MSAYGIHRKVREAIVAGIFYPEDAAGLSARLGAALLEASGPATLDGSPRPVAILSPHAAFDYSCDVQAAAWSAVGSRRIDRIVIIAPLRREGGSVAYLPESEAFQTPLGDVEVDLGACADLESCNTLFVTNDIPHLESHAVEVQLPFMRYLFPEASSCRSWCPATRSWPLA
jgi:hypothetical protein